MEAVRPDVCDINYSTPWNMNGLGGAQRNAYPSIVGSGPNACTCTTTPAPEHVKRVS